MWSDYPSIEPLQFLVDSLSLNSICAFILDTETIYTRVTQEIVKPYGKVFDWSVKSKMMGRSKLKAAEVLVEGLQLPLTAEEFVELSREKLMEQFPSAALLPGENLLSERGGVEESAWINAKLARTEFKFLRGVHTVHLHRNKASTHSLIL